MPCQIILDNEQVYAQLAYVGHRGQSWFGTVQCMKLLHNFTNDDCHLRVGNLGAHRRRPVTPAMANRGYDVVVDVDAEVCALLKPILCVIQADACQGRLGPHGSTRRS